MPSTRPIVFKHYLLKSSQPVETYYYFVHLKMRKLRRREGVQCVQEHRLIIEAGFKLRFENLVVIQSQRRSEGCTESHNTALICLVRTTNFHNKMRRFIDANWNSETGTEGSTSESVLLARLAIRAAMDLPLKCQNSLLHPVSPAT